MSFIDTVLSKEIIRYKKFNCETGLDYYNYKYQIQSCFLSLKLLQKHHCKIAVIYENMGLFVEKIGGSKSRDCSSNKIAQIVAVLLLLFRTFKFNEHVMEFVNTRLSPLTQGLGGFDS